MTPSRLGSEQPTMRRAGQRGRERGERAASRRWRRGGASPSSPVAGPHTSILWRHPGSAFIPNGPAPDLRTVPQPLIFLWNEYLCKCGDPLTGALALPFPLSLSYPDPIIHKSPIVVWMRAACRGGTERQALLRQERRRKRATAAAGFACDVQRGGQECGYLGGKRKVGLMVRPRPRPPPVAALLVWGVYYTQPMKETFAGRIRIEWVGRVSRQLQEIEVTHSFPFSVNARLHSHNRTRSDGEWRGSLTSHYTNE